MTTKEEALKLADEMDGIEFYSDLDEWACDAQRMIRRLVEELDKATYVLYPKIRNTEAEEVYDDLCMSWQADMENGVKWLNEKAVEDFKKNYPELNKSISRTMQFLWAIAEGGEPQTKPLSDEEILEYSDVFSLDKSPLYEFTDKGLVLLIRAIEERHGIK